ncbi:laminin subunit alpha-1-like isoform X2 [Limulus polyphemus]|uniref:Laminin subunit alpha-1-like isoform X2 n=1 Tax=Limulus polyphemus TaxID=6850 RepID=A0ABM1TR35_LIMPO|nr:laminin subunit alpha-1-like isoform X2 [Limulus polyphemus]
MASSLKVSLTTDKNGKCVRSYQPQIRPSTTNNIILNYALNKKDDRDSLLFYLASTVSDDFMAIEMVNRKIHFLWNAGGGTQVLKHGHTLQVNDEQLSKEEYWYIIEVNRIGNLATLTVKSASKKAEPDHNKVQGHSSLEFTKMSLNSSSHFFIGGIPSSVKVPGQVKTRSFAGCLYEVRLDGNRVGLWNFITNYGCSGCKEGVTGQVDASKYMFKGGGYAIHRQIKNYPYYEHTITLKFKTFDENALLFFTSNPQKGQFVSLELRSGKIVYQASVGPTTSRLIVSTTKSFNNGYLTRTTIQRRGNKVYLLANNSIIEGKADDWKKNDKIELNLSTKMYYGGVPPNFSASSWPDVVFQGFHGCMSGLQIGSTVVNLLNAEAYNLLPGCEDEVIKIVRFTGMGYLEMKGQPLERESNFSFTFLTKQENALLLLSTFEGSDEKEVENNYYSVAVVNGKLETRLNAGKGEKLIESSKPVNDGKYHTVTLLKNRRYVKLRIDDENVGSDEGLRLKGSRIDAPVNGGLFFGGVRNNMRVSQMTTTTNNLTGIIKDVIFNNR